MTSRCDDFIVINMDYGLRRNDDKMGSTMSDDKPLTKEELIPTPAAKPKGKTVWVIGLVLLVMYFMVDEENEYLMKQPFSVVTNHSAMRSGQSIDAWKGMKSLLEVESLLGAGFKIEDILSDNLSIEKSQYQVTLSGWRMQAGRSLHLKLEAGKTTYLNKEFKVDDGLLLAYQKVASILFSTFELKAHQIDIYPHTTADFDQYVIGLGLFRNNEIEEAMKYWGELAGKYPKLIALQWFIAQSYEGLNNKDKARQHYMKAVQLNPKLSKHLPDWVLGLK